jgi:hypothetical protein
MKYWPASELADAPGMHPNLAYEIRHVNLTRTPAAMIGEDAVQAGYVAAVNMVVIPMEVPIVVPPNPEGVGCPVFTRMPTPWEFHKLERAGITYDGQNYFFMACPNN